jgi:hypothetical protein
MFTSRRQREEWGYNRADKERKLTCGKYRLQLSGKDTNKQNNMRYYN